jgi:hypothetical protein
MVFVFLFQPIRTEETVTQSEALLKEWHPD